LRILPKGGRQSFIVIAKREEQGGEGGNFSLQGGSPLFLHERKKRSLAQERTFNIGHPAGEGGKRGQMEKKLGSCRKGGPGGGGREPLQGAHKKEKKDGKGKARTNHVLLSNL